LPQASKLVCRKFARKFCAQTLRACLVCALAGADIHFLESELLHSIE
jgi:hypothetical protein